MTTRTLTKLNFTAALFGVTALSIAMVAAVLATGLSAQAAPKTPSAPWNLAMIAEECQKTATNGQPGIVEIKTRLQDANVKARIDVPCVIHLVDGASVNLANVELTTQTLNLHDRSTGAEPSKVTLARTKITAIGEKAGILLELNDPPDSLTINASKITAPAGVAVRVAGQRGDENSGGSIHMAQSTILSDGPRTSGIQVLASEHSGKIHIVETILDTPGALTVLAANCDAVQNGKTLDCSTNQVGRDLGE